MNTLQRLNQIGQSVWCDNLSRGMIERGELRRLIDLGVVGVTSNPTIFMKAITGSVDYDAAFQRLLENGRDLQAIYEGLVLPDIADAADILRPVYDATTGVDGYVSLEVSPRLAYDTEGTIAEARRLFASLGRPNIFIKVPASDEGIPAVEALIGEGININVTLIFSLAVYEQVMNAYIRGLERFASTGGDVSQVASVASFFVSRVDTAVDSLLESRRTAGAEVDHLFGKAANANAKLAYSRFREVFGPGGNFDELRRRGARVQRPLWASTSTKNPRYPDTIYVDALIGPQTVNTMPPQTIQAALDHGRTEITIDQDLAEAKALFPELAGLGIDLAAITEQLRRDGVRLFADSFDELMGNIESKSQAMSA